MKTKKNVYWILSGEGDRGTWERVELTEIGIKRRLTKERCGGDRWAKASLDGFDIERGVPLLPPDYNEYNA